ncbi:MAG: signal peptidase I [Nitrospira sp.]|nr:signal peptidase I [Nitrospira sp.]
MNDLRLIFGDARGSKSLMMCLLLITLGPWTELSPAATSATSHVSDSGDAFQRLADLELSSNRLITTMSEVDADGFIQLLEQKADFAGPLASSEKESLRQSFVRSLQLMLKDENTGKLVKTQLAQLYATWLTPTEAQELTADYDHVGPDASPVLQVLRQKFIADHLRDAVETHWRSFRVPNQGMNPTLLPGDHFSIKKTVYQQAEPKRGDIIAFRYPKDETKIFIKRVVGLPQDRIEVRDKQLYVNGERLTESYIQHIDSNVLTLAQAPRDNLAPVVVPPNAYFVMGDNRDSSLDSRFWGSVSKELVLGKAMFIYWSIDPSTKVTRWNRLNRPMQ